MSGPPPPASAALQHILPSRPRTPASVSASTSQPTISEGMMGPQPGTTNNMLDSLVLHEATTSQERAACFRLGTTNTTASPAVDFNVELQQHLAQLGSSSLLQSGSAGSQGNNNETRIWYLSLPCAGATSQSQSQSQPPEPVAGSILAACKTVARDVLICEGGVARREKGYRLAAAVTGAEYRAFAGVIVDKLLERVMRWFDDAEGGDAGATFVYAPVLDAGRGGIVSGGGGGAGVGAGTPVEYLNTRGLLHKDARMAIATDQGHWANTASGQQERQQTQPPQQDGHAIELGEGVYRSYYNNSTAPLQTQSTSQSQPQLHPSPQRNPYLEKGYHPIHGVQAIFWAASLEWALATSSPTDRPLLLLPSSRPLKDFDEIAALAAQDVEQCVDFATQFAPYLEGTQVAVLPTAPTVRAWMEQARFTALHCPPNISSSQTTTGTVRKGNGNTGAHDEGEGKKTTRTRRKVEVFGAASNALPIWIYWYHDFPKGQLTIQRICTPHIDETLPGAAGAKVARTKALAQLVLDAMTEALTWGFSKVVVWEPDQRVEGVAELLGGEMDIRVEFEERGGGRQTAVRLRDGSGGGGGEVKMQLNEYFAWSG